MKIDGSREGIITLKFNDDSCQIYQIENYNNALILTSEEIKFLENLPPYYNHVQLIYEIVGDYNKHKIIINKVRIYFDKCIEYKDMTHNELNEWFYHNPIQKCKNIVNGIDYIEENNQPVIDWNNLTESQQDWIKDQYTNNDNKSFIEKLVGVENVNKKMFRTWKDVEKEFDITDKDLGLIYPYTLPVPNSLSEKMFAMFKIHILITLGYGEVITDKEWEYYEHERFWGYIADEHTGKIILTPIEHTRNFPVFHTEEQAKKFGSYPENMELLKTLLS